MADDTGRAGRALRSGFLTLPLAALVCACAREPAPVVSDPNTPPADYKADIIAYMRTYLNDPSGVRGAYIGEPELRNIPGVPSAQRYMVCLRFNAKDSTGKYEGSRDRLVAFLSGRLDTLVPARKDQCDKTNWQPFPELEKLKR